MSEHHRVLGLPTDATRGQIKKAFRNKAKLVHPDVNSSKKAHEAFIHLTSAYDALINGRQTSPTNATTSPGNNRSAYEKYRYVYTAPADPTEYKEWLAAAKQRAKEHAKKDYELMMKEVAMLRKIGKFLKIPSIVAIIWCLFVLVDLCVLPSEVYINPIEHVEPIDYGRLLIYTEHITFKGDAIDSYIYSVGNEVIVEKTPLLGVKNNVNIISDNTNYSYEAYHSSFLSLIVFSCITLCISIVIVIRWRNFNTSLLVAFYFGCIFELVGLLAALLG